MVPHPTGSAFPRCASAPGSWAAGWKLHVHFRAQLCASRFLELDLAFRILIADDHEIVRRGLRDIVSGHADWQVVGEALTGRQAVEQARHLKPDLIIMDISMPELNGLEAT